MININFNIALPWAVEFKNFWTCAWSTPFENKFVELEFHTVERLVGFVFDWTTRRDHAGIDIQISWFLRTFKSLRLPPLGLGKELLEKP